MQQNLVLVHRGSSVPKYLQDCVYQLLFLQDNLKIYILTNGRLVPEVWAHLKQFNLDSCKTTNLDSVFLIDLDKQALPNEYVIMSRKYTANHISFRDGFWMSTTTRFFAIEQCMKDLSLSNCFHIENDNMIYLSFQDIAKEMNCDKLNVVLDSPRRVIPSIVYIPNLHVLQSLNRHILNCLRSRLETDMTLLALFPEKHCLSQKITSTDSPNILFDGASIGQKLGGIDYRNIAGYDKLHPNEKLLTEIDNPQRGFLNETCDWKHENTHFKANINKFKTYEATYHSKTVPIVNLHIHSKQLYQFSSIFDVEYKDLITGDRVVGLCDFVLGTDEKWNYHKGLEKFIANDRRITTNFKAALTPDWIRRLENSAKPVKIFVYNEHLSEFARNVLSSVSSIPLILQSHNGDTETTNETLQTILQQSNVEKIFVQNISSKHDRTFLLPIGVANQMFSHGNLPALYTTMSTAYCRKKTKSLYIQMSFTHPFRKEMMQHPVLQSKFQVQPRQTYDEYLRNLSQHRFCLCVRGNGIACHREWECWYLGVVPVYIEYQNEVYLDYLESLGLPMVRLSWTDFLSKDVSFFSENLYRDAFKDRHIFLNQSLKISHQK